MQRPLRPLFQRRPLRNAVRLLLGLQPIMPGPRRGFGMRYDQPAGALQGQSQPAKPAALLDVPPVPSFEPVATPKPVTPMAQAVQPTRDALAVASDTTLDEPPTPTNAMRPIPFPPAVTISGGTGVYGALPAATPRPRTTEVPPPAMAPMKRAVHAQAKATPISSPPGSPVSQPTGAPKPASALQANAGDALAAVDPRASQAAQQRAYADQLNGVLTKAIQQFYANPQANPALEGQIAQLRADVDFYRNQADALDAERRAERLVDRRGETELKLARVGKPEDTLPSNIRQFAEAVRTAGVDAAVDMQMAALELGDTPMDDSTRAAQRNRFLATALGVSFGDSLLAGQKPEKGDLVTSRLAEIAKAQFPNDPLKQRALVQSVVNNGMVAFARQGKRRVTTDQTTRMTNAVYQMVQELVAENY